jgi:exodeoxyribonuclease VII large subunit
MNGSIPHEPLGEAERDVYTVTEISDAVRQHLESEFPRVSVIGEIANLKHHTSGHTYFTLRDSASVLHAVLFRRYAERLALMPENGMLVIAPGRVSHFGGSGQTQLIATDLIPAGRGSMELEFRRLLERLMDEGLTAAERKRSIPTYPSRIAVITSPTGAVIRDILDTIARRWPIAEVVHIPAEVQGSGAARSIVVAFETVNGIPDVDTVILARGGGSIEDLWTFNLEEVARAIAGCVHPVVTGIGHEIDTTVADYVADVRAATPTAAAELATPRARDVERTVADLTNRIALLGTGALENRLHLIEYLVRSGAFPAIERRMERAELEVDDSCEGLREWWRAHRIGLEEVLGQLERVMREGVRERGAASANSLGSLAGRLSLRSPREHIHVSWERIDHMSVMLRSGARGRFSARTNDLSGTMHALSALDPRGVLRRGYTVCTTSDGSRVLPRVENVVKDSEMAVHFHDGDAVCTVTRKRRKLSPWQKR